MRSEHLSLEQLAKLSARVCRDLRYFNGLVSRMDSRGFVPTEELYTVTLHARDSIHHLRVILHYLECDELKRIRESGKSNRVRRDGC